MNRKRIFLSPPYTTASELSKLSEVIDSNWVAPVGPHLELFEKRIEKFLEGKRFFAMPSGSSALEFALKSGGIGMHDEVLCSTFTFCAAANAIINVGAKPVFVDVSRDDWNIDLNILKAAIQQRLEKKAKLKALVCVHNYGMPCDMHALQEICKEYGLLLIEDAAESLGSKIGKQFTGGFGDFGVFSFNGNKIITTGGGGGLVVDSNQAYDHIKHLCTQARLPGFEYEHDEVGCNLRMSNVLAAIGLAQIDRLDEIIKRRQEVFQVYRQGLNDLQYQVEREGAVTNRWLSAFLFEDMRAVEKVITSFEEENIEVRKLWKPLHLQGPYSSFSSFVNGNAQDLHSKGVCLPSGFGLKEEDQHRIIDIVRNNA